MRNIIDTDGGCFLCAAWRIVASHVYITIKTSSSRYLITDISSCFPWPYTSLFIVPHTSIILLTLEVLRIYVATNYANFTISAHADISTVQLPQRHCSHSVSYVTIIRINLFFIFTNSPHIITLLWTLQLFTLDY